MKKILSIIGLLFLLACSQRSGEIEVTIRESEEDFELKEACFFTPRGIIVTLKNTTENHYYIPGVGSGEVSFDDYLPIMANYGSPQKDAEVRINKFHDFLQKGTVGKDSDEFRITLPVLYQRYQPDSEGDTIDLFHTISDFEEIYRTQFLVCTSSEFDIPTPEPQMDWGLADTLWMNPGKTITLNYDVTPFFLRQGSYDFQFFLPSDSIARPVTMRNTTFLPYPKTITSDKLNLK